MKKIIIFLIAILLLQSLPMGFSAEEAQYETIFDLLQFWDKNGYPDYISGIWSNDGTDCDLTLAIVEGEDGENGKTEILDLIKDDDSVKFVTMKYSRNYLLSIQASLYEYFYKGLGLQSMGLYDTDNKVLIEIKDDYINNEATKEFVKYVEETFGDAVQVEFTDLIIKTTAKDPITPTSLTIEKQQSFETYLYISAAILTVLTATAFLFFGRKKASLIQTTAGETFVQTKFSEKEIIESVKAATFSPSTTLDKKILDDIEKI